MIPSYINDWLTIIEQMNNDNTYKRAWGRAIIESVKMNAYTEENGLVTISFFDIAKNMLKYYWNQLFFFNLKQSPYDKDPVICQYTYKAIEYFKKKRNSANPEWFNIALEELKKGNDPYYDKLIKNIVTILHQNVSYRFKKVTNGSLEVYSYEKKNGSFITITLAQRDMLKDYNVIISELLNYKWSQLLEKYNYQPRISSKVKGISDAKIKRNSLVKYKEILLQQFNSGNIVDFYTGKAISINDVSIDHVIPWSFIYSDDIWNLVVTSKSMNSSKSNSIPSQEVIDKLKSRNDLLLSTIKDDKYRKILLLAKENNYVDMFYFDCRL